MPRGGDYVHRGTVGTVTVHAQEFHCGVLCLGDGGHLRKVRLQARLHLHCRVSFWTGEGPLQDTQSYR